MKFYLILPLFFALHAHANIILGLPLGEPNPQTGLAIERPATFGDLLKAVALNYRHRLSPQNFPSAAVDRVWFGRDRKTLVVGRVRKFLIEGRTTLVFQSESRAARFKELFEADPHQMIYLVYDSKDSEGLFFPRVHEEHLWLGIRLYNTPMNEPLVRLSEYLDPVEMCEDRLRALG